MRILIVGTGYVGLPLAAELVRQGNEVVGLRQSAEGAAALREAGVEPLVTDLSRSDFTRPTGRFDWVVFAAAAPGDADIDARRRLHVDGTRHLLAHFDGERPTKYVHVGCASVYGQQDASVVKEHSPTEPRSPAGQVQLEAERLVLDAAKGGFPAVILRVAEIYGPDRMPILDRFLRNEVILPGRGRRHLNMIHRQDVLGAVQVALRAGRPGEVYNVVDQEPVTETHFFSWLAETVGKWMPRFGPEETDPERLRVAIDHKVSQRRLTMELGYRLVHPTFRQGYTAEIKRLTDDGLLDVKPEPR